MSYYNTRTLSNVAFEEAVSRVTEALKSEGFGILTEIDLKETLKNKLGKDYLPHKILGACNPAYADRALNADMHISVMLPCNVTVKKLPTGEIEVNTIDPVAVMGSVDNEGLKSVAKEVQEKLLKALSAV